ncbi:MAG: hypothetical protein AAF682_23355 [Planctomycetota bacterium]
MRLVRRSAWFWVGFLLVLVARGLVAASRLDAFRGEELYQGSFAWALLSGMPLDPEHLPVIVHLRGSVVFGALAAPLFAAAGPSYGALKALASLWSAASGGILAWLLGRRFGARGALLGAGLFCLLPPAYLMVDASAFGSHLDAVLPILASLALLLAREGPLGWRRALALGGLLGFGAFFSLQFAVALPALLLAWLAVDRRFFLRPVSLLTLAGAALPAAAIPLVSTSTTLVTKPMSAHFMPEGVGGFADKLQAALGGDLVRALLFEVAGGVLAGWVYALAVVVALVLLAPRLRELDPLAVFALAHPLLVAGAFVASDFELNFVVLSNGMGSRYLMPMMPALVVALVLGVERLAAGPRIGAVALAAAPLVAGALGFYGLLDSGPLFDLPPRKGTNYPFFAVHFQHAGGGMRAQLDWADRVDPDWAAYRPLAYGFVHPPEDTLPAPGTPPPPAALMKVRELPSEVQPFVLASLGARAATTVERRAVVDAMEALPRDQPEAAWFLRGMGRGLMSLGMAEAVAAGEGVPKVYRALTSLPERGRDELALGAGFHLGHLFTPYNENFRAVVERMDALPPDVRRPFAFGLGLGWRLRFREETYEPPTPGAAKIEQLLAGEDRAAFRAALVAPGDAWR